MSAVHLSRGSLPPVSSHLRSEVAIICDLATRVLGTAHPVPWQELKRDYDRIRDRIERVVPGFDDFNIRVRRSDGFVLPHPPRDTRSFDTPNGKANFALHPLEWVDVPAGRLILQTLRSHDQYNTTVYGHDDRYRGISGNRHIVMVNPDDIASLGLRAGQLVDIVSEFDGEAGVEERRVRGFEVVPYDTPRGNAAAYYPETNPLVPLGSVARESNTPVSKAVVIRLEPAASA